MVLMLITSISYNRHQRMAVLLCGGPAVGRMVHGAWCGGHGERGHGQAAGRRGHGAGPSGQGALGRR